MGELPDRVTKLEEQVRQYHRDVQGAKDILDMLVEEVADLAKLMSDFTLLTIRFITNFGGEDGGYREKSGSIRDKFTEFGKERGQDK